MDEEQGKSREENSKFRGMKQLLREAHHVITNFCQENRELKRKLDENDSQEQTPQNKATPRNEISKGKEFMQSSETKVLANPTTPLTRSPTKKKSLKIHGKIEASARPPTSPTEG